MSTGFPAIACEADSNMQVDSVNQPCS